MDPASLVEVRGVEPADPCACERARENEQLRPSYLILAPPGTRVTAWYYIFLQGGWEVKEKIVFNFETYLPRTMVPGVARRWRGEAAAQRGGGEASLHFRQCGSLPPVRSLAPAHGRSLFEGSLCRRREIQI